MILEEAPRWPRQREQEGLPVLPVLPFLVSAKGEGALRAQAGRLRAHLLACPELAPMDVASSLATHSGAA